MQLSSHKAQNACLKELVRNGWTYYRGGRHGVLTHQKHPEIKISVSTTPSDVNGPKNMMKQVRKYCNIRGYIDIYIPPVR